MAMSNRERVRRGLDALHEGLEAYVRGRLNKAKGANWVHEFNDKGQLKRNPDGTLHLDNQALLKAMDRYWNDVFRDQLGRNVRSLVHEIIDLRNRVSHDETLSGADTERALDSMGRLLEAVGSPKAAQDLTQQREQVLEVMRAERARNKTRYQKPEAADATSGSGGGLRPWRDVVAPHPDVRTGRYAVSEFMADLNNVWKNRASPEYQDPAEFFRRTYLTGGLETMLAGAVERVTGRGGDPVIDLQTNFGGGKTHSMLALYHLFASPDAASLPNVDGFLNKIGQTERLPTVQRVVLVGTALTPGSLRKTEDGDRVRTLWGELAYQLAGERMGDYVGDADTYQRAPGSETLAQLLRDHGPCVILIDEWVSYLRNLFNKADTVDEAGNEPDVPGGTFEANLTFAQNLTEAVKVADGCLLVASLPQSEVEAGGEGGRQALDRLEKTVGRVSRAWRPASAEEGFEIVRRRLFEDIPPDAVAYRDATIRRFMEMYRSNRTEFPNGVSEGDYERRMRLAYPIHPELFMRLYDDWGGLEKFQRTRGVLRLLAKVIYRLWESESKGALILPASVPLDDSDIQTELHRYLPEHWSAVISKDIDGATSLSQQLDDEFQNLGRYRAARRAARAVFLGSAPSHISANPGIDDKHVRLACAQPGENIATYGDALSRMGARATYLYSEGARYWFSTRPSVNRTAEDRAQRLDDAEVQHTLITRLRAACDDRRQWGDFKRVHTCPEGAGEVRDDRDAGLVVLGPGAPHSARAKETTPAQNAALEILASRGSGQRIYKNMLCFLAPDQNRLNDVLDAVRRWMAWESIVRDDKHETVELTNGQRRQAQAKLSEWDKAITTRLQETWVWVMAPSAPDPRTPELNWSITRVTGPDALVLRASRKLVQEDDLFTELGPRRLRMAMDEALWPYAEHISCRQLRDYMASYLYLPRLRDERVLIDTIERGVGTTTLDHFAYADGYDAHTDRYLGLVHGQRPQVTLDDESVIVKPEVAERQREAEAVSENTHDQQGSETAGPAPTRAQPATTGVSDPRTTGSEGADPGAPDTPTPTRFFATADLTADRLGRDAGMIAEEIVRHLAAVPGAKVRVSLEIDAELSRGVDTETQRTVSENCDALKFKSHGFETD